MEKEKKQFRLFDIYRQFVTEISSKIKGIRCYKVTKYFDEIDVEITYEDGLRYEYVARDEDDLKKVINKVNKKLKNCSKPGRKQKVNY